MSKKKKVANTLTSVLDNPIMKCIKDKTADIEQVFEEVFSWWRYDMLSRKPGPAYIDENFVGTDLDLSCFLFELAERNAVINIPKYKGMRARSIKEGQEIVSVENRHGQITGLIANKDVFSFSLRIKDMNVVSSEGVGESRNFSLTDLDGDWYEGFKNLGFLPTAKENKFLFENQILVDDKIDFTNFVHPNRWSSMFGHHYFITKELIKRLKEESSYYYQEIKKMLAEGVSYPITSDEDSTEFKKTTKLEGKKIKVNSFEVEIDTPDNETEFLKYDHTQENLVKLTNKRNYYIYSVAPKLNFATRTVEYAYHKYGNNRIPSWLENVSWENNWVAEGKRIKWDRLVLFQQKVGEVGISIKKRVYQTTQEVSLEYDNRKGKLRNYVAIILDESGSMNSIRNETIGAFNQQLETIKQNSNEMETLVSLMKFSSVAGKPEFWNVPDRSVSEITEKNYRPSGMTALNDAIGYTIENLRKVDDVDDPLTSFLLIVISDGMENSSRRYPGSDNKEIRSLITEVQETNKWSITFLGANQNMQELCKTLNIPSGNATAFEASPRGMSDAGFTVTKGLSSYYSARRSGATAVASFYDSEP